MSDISSQSSEYGLRYWGHPSGQRADVVIGPYVKRMSVVGIGVILLGHRADVDIRTVVGCQISVVSRQNTVFGIRVVLSGQRADAYIGPYIYPGNRVKKCRGDDHIAPEMQ